MHFLTFMRNVEIDTQELFNKSAQKMIKYSENDDIIPLFRNKLPFVAF